MAQDGVEILRSGGSRVMGYVGVLLALVIAMMVLVDGYQRNEWKVLEGCALLGFACWVVLIRPMVAMTADRLLVRSMVSEAWLPLASVEQVRISQFLVVRAGGRTWSSTGLGRNRHQVLRLGRGGANPRTEKTDLVEDRIRQSADDARARVGIQRMSDEQFALAAGVRRAWAWPVIAALAVLAAVFLVGILV